MNETLFAASRKLLSKPVNGESSPEAITAWEGLCAEIKPKVPAQAFQTWFSSIRPIGFTEKTLSIVVPNRFYFEWIEEHYGSLLDSILQENLGSETNLQYILNTNGDSREEPIHATTPIPQDLQQNIQASVPKIKKNGSLNPRYLFENYIEGPQNSFARAASYAVGNSPGRTAYNPLLVYGGVGLGKTHLLQAIGHEALKKDPSLHVLYLSSQRFTQDFVESIRQNRAGEFNQRYQRVDLLLLDDVQFLAERDRTQFEFFHLFNYLHQSGKQIVLSSDRPPRDLDGLDERLVSRFGWGLVCDIGPPDFDTRIAIAQSIAEQEDGLLQTEVYEFIAEHFTKNVRDLRGAVVRLLALNTLTGQKFDKDSAREALSDLIDTTERKVSIETIQRVVADHYRVPADLLLAKTRTQPIAKARMVAMALATMYTSFSLKQIGGKFGGKDHTTVLHAKKSVTKWIKQDPEFSTVYQQLAHFLELAS